VLAWVTKFCRPLLCDPLHPSSPSFVFFRNQDDDAYPSRRQRLRDLGLELMFIIDLTDQLYSFHLCILSEKPFCLLHTILASLKATHLGLTLPGGSDLQNTLAKEAFVDS